VRELKERKMKPSIFNKRTPTPRLIATCDECKHSDFADKFPTEEDQDGWENPPYLIDICPECGNDDITNYVTADEEDQDDDVQGT